MNKNLKLLTFLSWLTQLGLSVASPILLCIGGAWLLAERFNVGPWIYAVAAFLGVGAAVASLLSFAKFFIKQGKKNDEDSQNR